MNVSYKENGARSWKASFRDEKKLNNIFKDAYNLIGEREISI